MRTVTEWPGRTSTSMCCAGTATLWMTRPVLWTVRVNVPRGTFVMQGGSDAAFAASTDIAAVVAVRSTVGVTGAFAARTLAHVLGGCAAACEALEHAAR